MFVRLPSGLKMFFDVDGERLAVAGERLVERPTLLVIHGSEVDHAFFKPWLAPLARDVQLLYVDLIGHGRSDAGQVEDWERAVVGGLCGGAL